MTGIFSLVLKTAKVVPIFKKDLNLDYSNYCPISLLSNFTKILEKRRYKSLYAFLYNNNIIYNLQFGFRQQYFTYHALINLTENIRIFCRLTKSYWYWRLSNTVSKNWITMCVLEFQMIGLNPFCLIGISMYS